MSILDLIVTLIAFIMLALSGFGFGQILIWLFMPTPIDITVKTHGVSRTKRVWLFRVWPEHDELLTILDEIKQGRRA